MMTQDFADKGAKPVLGSAKAFARLITASPSCCHKKLNVNRLTCGLNFHDSRNKWTDFKPGPGKCQEFIADIFHPSWMAQTR